MARLGFFFDPAHMHHGSGSWMAGTVQQQFARSSREQSTWFFLVHCCDRQSRFLGWECRIARIVRAVVPGLCTSRPVGCHLSHVGVSCKAGSMDWGCSIGLVVPKLSGNVALKPRYKRDNLAASVIARYYVSSKAGKRQPITGKRNTTAVN